MKITVKQITIGATVAALILFVIASIWMGGYLSLLSDSTQRLEYLKFSLDVYKAIGIGFLITLLGLAIPNILPEARYEFETLKEGREVYSSAKTGIDYLPYKLADLDFKNGIAHIESVHRLKHLADTYIQQFPRAGKWPYDAYARIEAYREVLVRQKDWDALPRKKRLELLGRI
jgi:hypothetical protein